MDGSNVQEDTTSETGDASSADHTAIGPQPQNTAAASSQGRRCLGLAATSCQGSGIKCSLQQDLHPDTSPALLGAGFVPPAMG